MMQPTAATPSAQPAIVKISRVDAFITARCAHSYYYYYYSSLRFLPRATS